MIEVVFFSVAGNTEIPEITEVFERWYNSEIVPKTYKEALRYTIEIVREGGHYPAKDYYDLYFKDSGLYYATVTELLHYSRAADDFFERQHLQESLLEAINTSKTADELKVKLVTLSETSSSAQEDDSFAPISYLDIIEKPQTEGLMTGLTPIDAITNGLQPTTVSTIAAFTGHGKSTSWVSILFKNAMAGRKCACISLEMAPELVWMQLQARYMYEVKNLQVTSTDLIQRKLTKENIEKLREYAADYKRDIQDNVRIVDSSVITKEMTKSSNAWIRLYKDLESKLGGLSLVIHDHVGQYDRLFPDLGNNMIKLITDATVRFRTKEGVGVHTGFACQTNREGYKRATKRNGVYDITAISDLNEVERSSTYVIFLYTPEDRMIAQETVVTMAKHRLGSILSEPTPVAFVPSVCLVGSNVEQISYGDSLSDLDFGGDFGDFSSMESSEWQDF